MTHLKFFFVQLILLVTITPISFVFDSLISPPFTWVDFVAGAVSIPFLFLFLKAIEKMMEQFEEVHILSKILMTIPAFILAIALAGYVAYSFFDVQ